MKNVKEIIGYAGQLLNLVGGKSMIKEIRPGLYQSGRIHDSKELRAHGIKCVIDLEGGFDGIQDPDALTFYLYHPIIDGDLPNMELVHQCAQFARLCIQRQIPVLSHCFMGLNRASLLTGCILYYLGLRGVEAVKIIQEKVPGSLSNTNFMKYLLSL